MCRTCDRIRSMPLQEALEVIGREIAAPGGRKAEHFKRLLDGLLGTEEPIQNEDADEAWERGNRGGS